MGGILLLMKTTTTATNPWHYTTITACAANGGIHVSGTNGLANGEAINWQLGWHSFKDPSFCAKRDSFKGATWGPGAKRAFMNLVARARRERGLSQRWVRPGDLGLS